MKAALPKFGALVGVIASQSWHTAVLFIGSVFTVSPIMSQRLLYENRAERHFILMKKINKKKESKVSFAEISVSFASDNLVLALPSDLRSRLQTSIKAKRLSDYCNLYMVLRRPSLNFIPNKVFCVGSRVFGEMRMTQNGQEKIIDFSITGEGGPLKWKVSEFPHRMAISEPIYPSHKLSIPAYVVPSIGRVDHPDAHRAEVLYIGQAFGDGQRNALDRLEEHSTLQRVLADAIYHTPDQDILLLLIAYGAPKMWMLVPPESTYPKGINTSDADADKEFDSRLDQLTNFRQTGIIARNNQISIIEAALINYFQPTYNKMFVHHSPSRSHRHLVECYNEDFSGLTVEVNTEDAQISLFSNVRVPGVHHLAKFDLHDAAVRKSFFRLLAFDSEVGLIESGPMTPQLAVGQSLANGRFAVLGW